MKDEGLWRTMGVAWAVLVAALARREERRVAERMADGGRTPSESGSEDSREGFSQGRGEAE